MLLKLNKRNENVITNYEKIWDQTRNLQCAKKTVWGSLKTKKEIFHMAEVLISKNIVAKKNLLNLIERLLRTQNEEIEAKNWSSIDRENRIQNCFDIFKGTSFRETIFT